MTNAEVRKTDPWNPGAAYEAHRRAEHDSGLAEEYSHTLSEQPSLGDVTVKIGDTPETRRKVPVAEYIASLRQQAETARAEVAAFGGQRAVVAYENLTAPGISYAGERPLPPMAQPPEGFSGFPTLP